MKDQFRKLENEIITICYHISIRNRVKDVYTSNTELMKLKSTLMHWMKRSFYADIVIRGARLCDKDKRSDSLLVFLKTLIEKYNNDEKISKQITEDINKLANDENCKKLVQYRNKHIAHIDQDRADYEIPTFETIQDAINTIEEIIKKYKIHILNASTSSYTPTEQFDWTDVLKIPWIND